MCKRKFTAEYKARLVIEMLREEEHISEIASREGISRTQLQNWKKEFLEKAPEVFAGSKTERETARREQEAVEREASMLKTIGQLTIERDYLMEEARKKEYKVYLRRPRGQAER